MRPIPTNAAGTTAEESTTSHVCRGVRWIAAVAAGLLWIGGVALAEDWPQFRGPNGTGISKESRNLPVKFSFEEKVKWSVELGKGIACPIVVGGRVFETAMVGEQEGEQKFTVFAFDAATGKPLWEKKFDTGLLPNVVFPNEHASSTPASDGDRVYVHFSTLGLLALNASDGNLIWDYPLPVPFYFFGWGAANSPIVYEDLVIFNLDDDLASYLIALDKYTGKLRWRTERPEMLGGYAVPVLCEAGGRTDIVMAGSGKLKGYDPATGKELWTCNTLLRTIMTTPAVENDKIYVSVQSYSENPQRVLSPALLRWKDINKDKKLSKSELNKAFWGKFDKGDKNKDGFLEDDEIDVAFQSPNNMVGGGNTIQAVKGGGSGDVTKTHLLWNLDNKAPSNISSPLVIGGRLFVVKESGFSASFDAQSGDTIWMQKRIDNPAHYYASPITGDGKIYVTGENGYIVVLKQGPRRVILAKNDMGSSCVATPAIADGHLYVRTSKTLYCLSED